MRSHGYTVWRGMIARCHNPAARGYARYGGRGIIVCARWRDSFAAFVEDVGVRPSEAHQIDRLDNDGNYEPSNVRWVTRSEQGRNKRDNRLVTVQGRTQCVAAWAEQNGLDHRTITWRLNNGWDEQRAVTVPPTNRSSLCV